MAGSHREEDNLEGRTAGSLSDVFAGQHSDDADLPDEGRNGPEYFDDERVPPFRGGKRALGWLIAAAAIAALAAAAWFGARELLGVNYADYDDGGDSELIIEVADGDSTRAIAETLVSSDVVASTSAFLAAGEGDGDLRAIQPGYYVLRSQMSGERAVEAITDPDARVGELEVQGGTQLDDVAQPDESTKPGVLSLISEASCVELNGKSTCVSPEQLREVAAETDLSELGVPEWLAEEASDAEPERRLEGLVIPGVYDVQPGSDAREMLVEVVNDSMSKLEAAGLPGEAESAGQDPYEMLTIASLLEHEAVQNDFDRVARVIDNRRNEGMRLELDSTINYVLERPEVRTSAEDRERQGPYNTYQNTGLPPTPIAAPSVEALHAAQDPADGEWLFFVKCEDNGLSCFADTYEEHRENVEDAQARGVY